MSMGAGETKGKDEGCEKGKGADVRWDDGVVGCKGI